MRNMWFVISSIACLLGTTACAAAPADGEVPTFSHTHQDFGDYWYQGQAEITRYQLDQARYGEMRDGDAVLIFVTEDFLRDAQIKKEFGDDPADSVLKLNYTKKFLTGIYPYSIMMSVFTKADQAAPSTPKVSFSSQEWCGHMYMQLNRTQKGYDALMHSYFQAEGDSNFTLPDVLLEDEIMTRIRVNPASLPTGNLQAVPSSEYVRLRHKPMEAQAATATMNLITDETFGEDELAVYRLAFKESGRELAVYFESQWPYKIAGWREKASADGLTTTAVATNRIMSPYWGKNSNDDTSLRGELGLDR